MAKKKGKQPETKTEFLRRVLSKNPELEYQQVLQRWTKAGHPGVISNALYYQVRAKLGIKTVWTWGPAEGATPGGTADAQPKSTGQLFQFKITLAEVAPPVWRRIQVNDCMLDKLHEHIQTAMGWTNSHLHHFKINQRYYGDPQLMAVTFEELNYADSTTTLLSQILPPDGSRFAFEYEYDFGDGWMHEILFEGRPPADPKAKYPLCLEGGRACPPEDVGGAWGYADFLEAVNDPEHESHDELLSWAGGKFAAEEFNPATATRRMKKGLPNWRAIL